MSLILQRGGMVGPAVGMPSSGGGLPLAVMAVQQTNTASVASVDAAAPADITPGELLLLIVSNQNGVYPLSTDLYPTIPAGWTKATPEIGGQQADSRTAIFWKEADGTEGTVNVPFGSGNAYSTAFYIRISGADTTDPFNARNDNPDGSNHVDTHPNSGITTDVTGCLIMATHTSDGADCIPHDITEEGWESVSQSPQGGASASGASVWKMPALQGAGSTGTITFTQRYADGGCNTVFAINPA